MTLSVVCSRLEVLKIRTFEDEFGDWLEPITLGTIDKSAGSWTEEHTTVGFFETLSGGQVWIAERPQVEFSHRVFLPNEGDDGVEIVLDSTIYIVRSGSFAWSTDTDEPLYQVQDRQGFDYYQYALVRAVDI